MAPPVCGLPAVPDRERGHRGRRYQQAPTTVDGYLPALPEVAAATDASECGVGRSDVPVATPAAFHGPSARGALRICCHARRRAGSGGSRAPHTLTTEETPAARILTAGFSLAGVVDGGPHRRAHLGFEVDGLLTPHEQTQFPSTVAPTPTTALRGGRRLRPSAGSSSRPLHPNEQRGCPLPPWEARLPGSHRISEDFWATATLAVAADREPRHAQGEPSCIWGR